MESERTFQSENQENLERLRLEEASLLAERANLQVVVVRGWEG